MRSWNIFSAIPAALSRAIHHRRSLVHALRSITNVVDVYINTCARKLTRVRSPAHSHHSRCWLSKLVEITCPNSLAPQQRSPKENGRPSLAGTPNEAEGNSVFLAHPRRCSRRSRTAHSDPDSACPRWPKPPPTSRHAASESRGSTLRQRIVQVLQIFRVEMTPAGPASAVTPPTLFRPRHRLEGQFTTSERFQVRHGIARPYKPMFDVMRACCHPRGEVSGYPPRPNSSFLGSQVSPCRSSTADPFDDRPDLTCHRRHFH